jgi:MYXO-CTERM domain-containing protein
MQLVVNQGEAVNGTIGITINLGGLAGATTTIQNQMFGPLTPPSPGALPALAVAAIVCGRRRR